MSEVLGLELGVEGWRLRLYDPGTGEKLLTPMEQAEARRKEAEARRLAEEMAKQAEEKVRKEAEARMAAEAEVLRLRAELGALRKES